MEASPTEFLAACFEVRMASDPNQSGSLRVAALAALFLFGIFFSACFKTGLYPLGDESQRRASLTINGLNETGSIRRAVPGTALYLKFSVHLGISPLAKLRLEYAPDGENFVLVQSWDTPQEGFQWPVAAEPTANALLRLTVVTADGQTMFTNSAVFQVAQITTMRLTSFTGGQAVRGGASTRVTWNAKGTFGAGPITLELSADEGNSWTVLGAGLDNSGSYSWAVPAGADGGTYRLRISAVDFLGTKVADGSSANFYIDSQPPTLAAGAMTINGGATSATLNYVRLALRASDTVSPITHFCFKNTSASPTATDPCWRAVNAPSPGLTLSQNLVLANFPYVIGFVAGNYTLYAFTRDTAGNVSTLSGATGTAGRDRASIGYNPPQPPMVINVTATATDTPSHPLVPADLNTPAGSDVVIKWKATSAQGFGSSPISLYYTTDETNFISIATNLSNSATGCTLVSGTHTGCYRWNGGAPVSSYFRVRVAAADTNGMTTFTSGPPDNVAGTFNFLAGNTDPGLGASATAAIFFNDTISASVGDPGSVAVDENGVVYFKDIYRGVLMIRPEDGVQRLLIPTTGTASGDGGPVSAATLKQPMRITLDDKNRLLIFDFDRIRRVDTSVTPMIVDTFIGGGSAAADGVPPSQVLIVIPGNSYYPYRQMPFFALPNGDFYFQSEGYGAGNGGVQRIRIFHQATGLVTSLTPSGTGTSANASQDLSACAIFNPAVRFDVATSALLTLSIVPAGSFNGPCYPTPNANLDPVTAVATAPHAPAVYGNGNAAAFRHVGKNGELYLYHRYVGEIRRFDPATTTWVKIAGSGSVGSCPDGTLDTACAMEPMDIYVSAQGLLYFMDRGKLRVVDANHQVQTILGQGFAFGDGGDPLSARFGGIDSIDQWQSAGAAVNFILNDNSEFRFREFSSGGTIQTLAGNGNNVAPNTTSAASTQGLAATASGRIMDAFTVDPTNGDIYHSRAYRVSKLLRSTGLWTDLVGDGSTSYYAAGADGLAGSAINIGPSTGVATYLPLVLGFHSSAGLLVHYQAYDAVANALTESFLKNNALSDGLQSHVAGVNGHNGSTVCADGTPSTSCGMPASFNGISHPTLSRATYDATNGKWIFLVGETKAVRQIAPTPNGGSAPNMDTLTTLTNAATSFAYVVANSTVYYCDTSGRLRKKVLAPVVSDTALAWPAPTVNCVGDVLLWRAQSLQNAAVPSLVFPFVQNRLSGMVEYLNP